MRKRDPELSENWGTICTPVRMTAKDRWECYFSTKRRILCEYSGVRAPSVRA